MGDTSLLASVLHERKCLFNEVFIRKEREVLFVLMNCLSVSVTPLKHKH